MRVYDEIRMGLEQAVSYEQGKLPARKTTMGILPPAAFSAEEIKAIRRNTGLTQAAFAACMGVSRKTIEAWETGRNHPSGPARRLLALVKENASYPLSFLLST